MNFYTKVLSKFAATAGLKLTLRVEVAPAEGVSPQKVDETKVALRELGLSDAFEGDPTVSTKCRIPCRMEPPGIRGIRRKRSGLCRTMLHVGFAVTPNATLS